jgi:hypothetical protein
MTQELQHHAYQVDLLKPKYYGFSTGLTNPLIELPYAAKHGDIKMSLHT